MSSVSKLVEKAMKTIDWKAFAKAFQDANLDWHAEEWKNFMLGIKSRIKEEEHRRIDEIKAVKMEDLSHFKDQQFKLGFKQGFNTARRMYRKRLFNKIKKEPRI